MHEESIKTSGPGLVLHLVYRLSVLLDSSVSVFDPDSYFCCLNPFMDY